MYTKITYICDGAIYCGFNPGTQEVIEERTVLYAKEGYTLQCKINQEIVGNYIWLKPGDSQNNYNEVKNESIIN